MLRPRTREFERGAVFFVLRVNIECKISAGASRSPPDVAGDGMLKIIFEIWYNSMYFFAFQDFYWNVYDSIRIVCRLGIMFMIFFFFLASFYNFMIFIPAICKHFSSELVWPRNILTIKKKCIWDFGTSCEKFTQFRNLDTFHYIFFSHLNYILVNKNDFVWRKMILVLEKLAMLNIK